MENLLGSSLNQIQGWTTVQESYSHALEQRPLPMMQAHLRTPLASTSVEMHLATSGNSSETSLPTVIEAMIFFNAADFRSCSGN